MLLLAATTILSSCASSKELERFTMDEAFEKYKSNYRIVHDENFSTDKETYGVNEEAIIYRNGSPIASWKFKEIKIATGGSYTIDNADGFRIALEVTNFNINSSNYVPSISVSHIYTTMVTDLGTEVRYYSHLANEKSFVDLGESDTIHMIVKNEALGKDVNKLYIRYYYIEDILALPHQVTSNNLQFELELK